MILPRRIVPMAAAILCVFMPIVASGAGENVTIAPPEDATRAEGLAAFERTYEVTSHPRCSNCHVGADNLPMWSGPSYGETLNDVPHAAPQVAMTWMLAPVEAAWFGKPAVEVCRQLRDPESNGGRDMLALAAHLDHDLILHWAWEPGGGREPAPYSLQEHVDDILIWGVAGMPCPEDQ